MKKSDVSASAVTVRGQAIHAIHPDGAPVVLGQQYDHLTIASHSGGWSVVARGYPDPIGPWITPGGSFTRTFNADTAGFEDVRGALNALVLDLKSRRVLG